MTQTKQIDDALRDTILAEPDVILNDTAVMNALVGASERTMGANIVDLRGIAMDRLEARLDRLEDTHRSVIAAAYDNLAGTNQIHRAILRLLDPTDFESLLADLNGPIAETLGVGTVRLVLESRDTAAATEMAGWGHVLRIAEPGFADRYSGAATAPDVPRRPITLRQVEGADPALFGDQAHAIRSEAVIALDLGAGRLPGLLVLGSEDPDQFGPMQGTDLLAFFGGVFERTMRRWLA